MTFDEIETNAEKVAKRVAELLGVEASGIAILGYNLMAIRIRQGGKDGIVHAAYAPPDATPESVAEVFKKVLLPHNKP